MVKSRIERQPEQGGRSVMFDVNMRFLLLNDKPAKLASLQLQLCIVDLKINLLRNQPVCGQLTG